MTAALRGRRKADKLRAKSNLLNAYHSGAFAGAAFNGQLKPFEHYAREPDQRIKNAHAISFFHGLKAKGLPVEITRTVN